MRKPDKNQSEILYPIVGEATCNSPRHFPIKHRADELCPICAFCDRMIQLSNNNSSSGHRHYKGIAVNES